MSEVVNVLVAFAVIVFLFRWVTSGTCSLPVYADMECLNCALGSDSSGQDAQSARRAADALGFRPRNVTNDMVCTTSFRPAKIVANVNTGGHCCQHVPRYSSVRHHSEASSHSQLRRKSDSLSLTDSDNIRYDLLRTGNTQLTTTKILERGFLDAVRVLPFQTPYLVFTIISFSAAPDLLHLLPTRDPGGSPSRRSSWPTCSIHLIRRQETEGHPNLEVQSPGPHRFWGESSRGGSRWQSDLGGLSGETRGEPEGAQGSNDFGGEAVSAFRST